jgi:hypothetical protein
LLELNNQTYFSMTCLAQVESKFLYVAFIKPLMLQAKPILVLFFCLIGVFSQPYYGYNYGNTNNEAILLSSIDGMFQEVE